MTAPRQVLPGTTSLVTRRCSQRQFFLRPSKATTELLGFLLAVAAERFHIHLHAFCAMSNHLHLVLTDPEARLPAFMGFLDSLVGRSMNPRLGRDEHFWSSTSYSAVALQTPDDIIDKVVYVLANPVTAGLVQHGRLWPGLWSAPREFGAAPTEFLRPGFFFRKRGATALPMRASLSLVVPPGFNSAATFRRAVEAALALREEAVAVELAALHRGFLGVRRVLAQPPTARPRSPQPRGGLNPRVACKDKWRRIEALGHLKQFLTDYRRALQAWRARSADVLFPAGTYLMRVLHLAPCEAPA